MDKTTAVLIALGILALLALAFKGKIKASLWGLKFEAKNDPPPTATPSNPTLASDAGSGAVSVTRSQAGRDIFAAKEMHVHQAAAAPQHGSAPTLPSLVIGREEALADLKARLGIPSGPRASVQVLTAIRGWPGVGKTTVASALAHDPEIAAAFPDGVLWVSLGPKPNLLSELVTWGLALNTNDLLRAPDLAAASAMLSALLRDKRTLLIVDDVWEAEHLAPFKVGGRNCAML
ncbi:MAG: NB-ARC domain-containing protein, partial [Lentisphaeria bacterium]